MDYEPELYSLSRLNSITYRQLQKIAKALHLPSNFKRIYLIELILAKHYSSDLVVESVIRRAYQERKEKTLKKDLSRGEIVQGTEITSASRASPPLTITPHRYRIYNPRSRRPKYLRNRYTDVESDRVLRSAHAQYQGHIRVLNIDSSIDVYEQGRERSQEREYRSYISYKGSGGISGYGHRKAIGCHHCGALSVDRSNDEGQLALRNRLSLLPCSKTPRRRLNGIYKLEPAETRRFHPLVTYHRQSGRVSKIHSIVERLTARQREKIRHTEINKQVYTYKETPQRYTMQDIIDQNVDWNMEQNGNEREIFANRSNDFEGNRFRIENEKDLTQNGYERVAYAERNEQSVWTEATNYQIDENANNVYMKPGYSKADFSTGERSHRDLLPSNKCCTNINCAQYEASSSQYGPPYNGFPCNGNTYPSYSCTDQAKDFAMRNSDYPNTYASTEVYDRSLTELKSNDHGAFTSYYQKLQAESAYQRSEYNSNGTEELPRINEVFSQFNDAQYNKCVVPPLYVEVAADTGLSLPPNNNEVAMYGYKNQYASNAGASNTTNVGYTVSHVQAGSPNNDNDSQAQPSAGPSSGREVVPKLYQLLKIAEQERDSLENSAAVVNSYVNQQEDGVNTNAERMEDALELISQDGDYNERVALVSAHTRCVACGWAGAAHALPAHIAQVGTTNVEEDLPKYSRLIVYNKGGEAFAWEGEISHVSQTTQGIASNGLNIDIGRLDLLPAHLRLINGIVYSDSIEVDSNVLDDIHMVVCVSVFD